MTPAPPNIRPILDPLNLTQSVKADVWDQFHAVRDQADFRQRFDKLALPREAKAALWDARFGERRAERPLPGTEETGLPGVPTMRGAAVEEVGGRPMGEQVLGMGKTALRGVGKAALSTLGGFGGAAEAVGTGLESVLGAEGARRTGIPGVGKALTAVGKNAEYEPPHARGVVGKSFLDDPSLLFQPDYIVDLLGTGAGSTAAMFLPGLAVADKAGKLLAAAKLTGRMAKVAEAVVGSGAGAVVETLADAGNSYHEAIREHGAKPEVAARVFAETLKRELPATAGFNLAGLFNPATKGVWKAVFGAAAEAAQEPSQGVSQRSAMNKIVGTQTPLMQGADVEALGGALGGGVMGGAVAGAGSRGQGPGARGWMEEATAPPPLAETAPLEQRTRRPRATAPVAAQPTAAPENVQSSVQSSVEPGPSARLPRELAGAKPRYSFGESQFDLTFADDLDRAAYIAAQKKRSKRDADYVQFVAEQTGLQEGEIRALGGMVRAQIKGLTRSAEPGVLSVGPVVRPFLERQRGAGNLTREEQSEAESAEVSVATDPDAAARQAVTGTLAPAKVAQGYTVDTQYAVVPASALIASHDLGFNENPNYPQEVQPRDRTRKASRQQVNEIFNTLDARELGASYKATDGAPIVGEDLVVESGNARTLAIRRAYGEKSKQGERYRQYLTDHASEFGLDAAAIAAMDSPVLVRIRKGLPEGVTRAEFARHANKDFTASMSATEQAASDASKLTGRLMETFAPSEEGDLLAASNRDFVRGFFDQVLGPTERGQYMLADGSISQAGVVRVRNAVFARAYGESAALEKMAESPDSNIRNITSGMVKAAPAIARMSEAIGRGELHALDLAADVGAAAAKLSALREEGGKVADYLKQENLFGRELKPEARHILATFATYAQSGSRIGEILQTYAEAVERLGSPKQESIFGSEIPGKLEVLQSAINVVEERHGRVSDQTSERAAASGQETGRDDAPEGPREDPPRPQAGRQAQLTSKQKIVAKLEADLAAAEISGNRALIEQKKRALRLVRGKVTTGAFGSERGSFPLRGSRIELNREYRIKQTGKVAIAREIRDGIVWGQNPEGAQDLLRLGRPDELVLLPPIEPPAPQSSLFTEAIDAGSRAQSKRNAAKLLGSQLSAQFKSGMAIKPVKRAKPAPQTSLFEETPEEPQGNLFGSERGSFSLRSLKPLGPRSGGVTVSEEHRDFIGSADEGENKYSVLARSPDGKLVGAIDYAETTSAPDRAHIEYIAVHPAASRSGVATSMVAHLANKYGYRNIDWGFLTEDGAKLKAATDKQFGESQRSSSERGSLPIDKETVERAQIARERVFETARVARDFVSPAGSLIARQGEPGAKLKKLIDGAFDRGEVKAGKRLVKLADAGMDKLSPEERVELLDVLEGRADETTGKVWAVHDAARVVLDEMGREAVASGVETRFENTIWPGEQIPAGLNELQLRMLEKGKPVTIRGKRAFHPRADFFPHVIRSASELKKGIATNKVREDVISNLVRQDVRANREDAAAFLDDYIAYIETGKRQASLVKHLVESGQASSAGDALFKLQRYRQRTIKRAGSLEFAREIDLPFYDPDPARVLPGHIAQGSVRLEQIAQFGQENQRVNRLINQVRKAGGDADLTRVAVDRILNMVNEPATPQARLGRAVRTYQGFKLGLAAIPNMTQGTLNTLLAGDVRAVIAGVKGLATKEGRRFGVESGAALETVLNESMRHAGASGKLLGNYLRATGFTATERFNRILAANGGANYAGRLAERLAKNPGDTRASDMLRELGLDVEKVKRQGRLEGDDVLMAAKKFSDLTQFRSRPQDLPLFASSEVGKVFFQFKSFMYGQTRLIGRETIGEFKAGRPGRAFRTLLVLGIAFPIAGELVKWLRSLATGRERGDEPLQRYLEDVAAVGATGVLGDMVEAGRWGRGGDFIVGPTFGELGQAVDLAGASERQWKRWLVRHIPVVGPLADQMLGARVLAPKKRRAVE